MSQKNKSPQIYPVFRQTLMLFFLFISLVSALNLVGHQRSNESPEVTYYRFDQGDELPEDVQSSTVIHYHWENHQLLFQQRDTHLTFPRVSYTQLVFVIDVGLLDEATPLSSPEEEATFLVQWGQQQKNITVKQCDVYTIEFNIKQDAPIHLTYHHGVEYHPGWTFLQLGVKSIKWIGQTAR